MNEYDPNKTIPPKPNDTQRFPAPDFEKTNPHIVVKSFPKAPEHVLESLVPPDEMEVAQVGETRVYGDSLKLVVKKVDAQGFEGEDENGASYFISNDKIKDFPIAK